VTAAAPVVTLSAATVADLDAIEELEGHAFPAPWPRSVFEAELARSDAHIAIARDERAQLVAFCNYRLAEGELSIHAIATHPDHRARGIAGRVLAHVLDHARATACTTAHLEVRRSNAPAIALYTRAGFRTVRVRARYYRDGEDAIVMTCEL
jgi:ribosomal-protein-alanine N-acetyltransferase